MKNQKVHCPLCNKMIIRIQMVNHLFHHHEKTKPEAMTIYDSIRVVHPQKKKVNSIKRYYSKIEVIKDLEKIVEKLKSNCVA